MALPNKHEFTPAINSNSDEYQPPMSEYDIELARMDKDPRLIADFEEFAVERKASSQMELVEESVRQADPLKIYVRQVPNSLLTSYEEKRLARLKDEGDQAAKTALIEHNLRLVISIARRHQSRYLPMMDLIQEGNLGLIRAIEKFDYKMGYRVTTYATWWIKQSIARAVAEKGRNVRLPIHVHEEVRKMVNARRKLEQEQIIDPTPEEIAAKMDSTPGRVLRLMELAADHASLDTPVGNDYSVLGDFVEDENAIDPERHAIGKGEVDIIKNGISKIREKKSRDILIRRYGLDGEPPETLEEVGRRYGVTRERVRQIEKNALKELESFLRGDGINSVGDFEELAGRKSLEDEEPPTLRLAG